MLCPEKPVQKLLSTQSEGKSFELAEKNSMKIINPLKVQGKFQGDSYFRNIYLDIIVEYKMCCAILRKKLKCIVVRKIFKLKNYQATLGHK